MPAGKLEVYGETLVVVITGRGTGASCSVEDGKSEPVLAWRRATLDVP